MAQQQKYLAYDDMDLWDDRAGRCFIIPRATQLVGAPGQTAATALGFDDDFGASASAQDLPKPTVYRYDRALYVDRLGKGPLVRPVDITAKHDVALKPCRSITRIYGLLGIIDLLCGPYLVVVTEREYVGCVRPEFGPVYRIKRVAFVPAFIRQSQQRPSPGSASSSASELTMEQKLSRDAQYCSMLSRVIAGDKCCFLSYQLDLTRHLQDPANRPPGTVLADGSVSTQDPFDWYKQANSHFWWNRFLSAKLVKLGARGFIVPMIRGIVEIFPSVQLALRGPNAKPFTFAILSRTGSKRAGTRYNCRGADQKGSVANFVESEQIVIVDRPDGSYLLSSFIQIRGSIPLIWSQYANLKYTPEIQFLMDKAKQGAAFKAHFDDIHGMYGGPIVAINLCKKKPGSQELRLSEVYEAFFRKTIFTKPARYVTFDFHHETKGLNYTKVYNLLEKLRPSMREIGFFLQQVGQMDANATAEITDSINKLKLVEGKVSLPPIPQDLLLEKMMASHNSDAAADDDDDDDSPTSDASSSSTPSQQSVDSKVATLVSDVTPSVSSSQLSSPSLSTSSSAATFDPFGDFPAAGSMAHNKSASQLPADDPFGMAPLSVPVASPAVPTSPDPFGDFAQPQPQPQQPAVADIDDPFAAFAANRAKQLQQQQQQQQLAKSPLSPGKDMFSAFGSPARPTSQPAVKITGPLPANTVQKQSGTFRINCIDCCDRTNVTMTYVAKTVLAAQLVATGIMPNEADALAATTGSTPFTQVFNHVWANNGDKISILYSGTGALMGDYTRSGERTVKGLLKDGLNSVTRYMKNNFADADKQRSINLVLGLLDPNSADEQNQKGSVGEAVSDLFLG